MKKKTTIYELWANDGFYGTFRSQMEAVEMARLLFKDEPTKLVEIKEKKV